jgi:predicted enzyme related to lactoylglutathione lyase
MIRHHMFVIAVPDLERSAAFYRDVLGFEIHDMGDPGWRMYVRDACRIMAGECRDAMPVADTGEHSYFAYLEVDDADSWHRRVTDAGADICKPLASEPWQMREFGVRTVDGHRIMIGHDLGAS